MKKALASLVLVAIAACGNSSPPANPAPAADTSDAATPPGSSASAAPASSAAPSASAAPATTSATSTPDGGAPWGEDAETAQTGFGSGKGHAKPPKIRQGATQVNGRLPPEVIQRIVRQHFGKFRLCYEAGLARNPKLEGRVTAKFVIDKTGAVSGVADGGSTLPDKEAANCVLQVFTALTFPQPEGGIVTVVYPVVFEPPGS